MFVCVGKRLIDKKFFALFIEELSIFTLSCSTYLALLPFLFAIYFHFHFCFHFYFYFCFHFHFLSRYDRESKALELQISGLGDKGELFRKELAAKDAIIEGLRSEKTTLDIEIDSLKRELESAKKEATHQNIELEKLQVLLTRPSKLLSISWKQKGAVMILSLIKP